MSKRGRKGYFDHSLSGLYFCISTYVGCRERYWCLRSNHSRVPKQPRFYVFNHNNVLMIIVIVLQTHFALHMSSLFQAPEMAPNILELPRELRDVFYKYLYRPIQFQWAFRQEVLKVPVDVLIPEGPILSVLLICSRTYEEYKEYLSSKDLSATIDHWGCLSRDLRKRPYIPNLRDGPPIDCILPKLRHVTFLAGDQYLRDQIWDQIGYFADILIHNVPQLLTLRIGLKREIRCATEHDVRTRTCPYANWPQEKVIFAPGPNSLAGMPLAQHTQGYSVEYAHACDFEHSNHPIEWSGPDSFVPLHLICKYATYLYTWMETDQQLWTPEQIFKYWTPSPYPQELRHWVDQKSFERMQNRRYDMMNWEEGLADDAVTLMMKAAALETRAGGYNIARHRIY